MRRYTLRLLFALAVIFGGTVAVKAETLNIVTEVTGADVVCYSEESAPTTSYTGGTPAVKTYNGRYLVIKVTPNDGKWIYNEMLTIEAAGKPGGALVPRRAPLGITATPNTLNTSADGSGYYYYQIPADWTYGNNCYMVIVRGAAVDKIDLSGVSIDGTGKIVTATTGGWTATVTLDQVSWTYDGSAHVPNISSFTLSNGTKTFSNTADQVSISGSGTNAGNYNATLSSVDNGCLKNSKQVPFSISKKAVTLTSGSKTREYNGTALTNSEVEGKNANGLTVETGWIDGEGATYNFTGSQTTEGESDNAFSYEAKSGTLLANYTITKTEGKLTVTKNTTAITVKPASGSKVYDGTSLTKTAHEDFTVTGVPDGFIWTATADGTVTNVTPGVGEKAVNAVTSFKIFNGSDDVTNQFSNITTSATGTLSVTQREITASVADKNATYNGTEQSGNSEVTFTNVATGQTATISYTPAKGTMVATYDNGSYGTDLKVMSGTTDVTANYNLTTKTVGKLIIGKASKAITITAASQSWTYDGNLHTNTTVTVTSGTLFDGDVLVATATGGVTNVSDNIPDNNPIAEGYKVMHVDVDVTANYTITPVAGTLTINQKEVGLTWTNTHLTFNGTEQVPTCEATGLVNGDEVSVTVTVAGEHSAVGNYTATASALTGAKAGNYKLPTDNTHSFSIDEAGMTGIVATGFNNTYDGTAHGINVTIPDGATVKFGETEGTYDLNTSPEYTDVCNNIVYYKVTKAGFSDVTGSAKVIITQKEVGLNWTNTSLVFDGTPQEPHCTAVGLVNGDEVGVTVTVAGEHTAVGNYTATASALTGAKAGNYKLPDANTQAFSISAVLTTIRVVRNDTGEDVPNVVATTESIDGEGHEIWTIDRVNITAPADASANKLVSVSVYIPATIKAGADDKVLYGVGSDILVTSAYVPVTDIYMPETDEIIDVQANAFRLNATASVTARIHTPLALLDDYALNAGLKDEYEDGHVMSTISPTTHYWTLSSGVDVVVPNGVTAYTCQADGTSAVAAIAITNTTAMVEETERVIIKANNGVLMGNQSGTGGTYDLVAWPSADRPSGTAPTTIDAKTYDGNLMEPALVRTHFAPNDYYILYNNTFHELKPTDDTFVSPCKAVLRKNSSVMASKLRINVGSDTGINELVNSEESVDDWYTLDGVKLNSKPTQKGVYINGGKKVIMK